MNFVLRYGGNIKFTFPLVTFIPRVPFYWIYNISPMRTVLIFFLLAWLLPACKKGDQCTQYQSGSISKVRYMGTSASGIVGQDAAFFDVSCVLASNCYAINKMVESKNGNIITIKPELAFNACGACPATTVTVSKTYTFVPAHTGTYFVKWEGLPDRTDTVVIR